MSAMVRNVWYLYGVTSTARCASKSYGIYTRMTSVFYSLNAMFDQQINSWEVDQQLNNGAGLQPGQNHREGRWVHADKSWG